jgi:hypothetical protein
MKKIALFSTLLGLSCFCFAQKSAVIYDSTETKAVIFSKSVLWATKTWKNANEVIQLKDEESGTIVIKGGLQSVPKSLGVPAKGITTTQITIHVKDGRVKIEFENTSFRWADGTVWTMDETGGKGQKEKWYDAVLKEMDAMIENYKLAILKKQDDF